MPLIKYFVFVGSTLVLFLIGLGWCFPQPLSEPSGHPGGVDRPVIRIASAEQLPERVTIDTSLPTIVPPPSELEFAERWPQATVADATPVPTSATPAPASHVSVKQNFVKQNRSKKVAVHRAAPKAKIESARNDKGPTSSAVTRLSLLDSLKQGLAQTQAKLVAGLEPLTAYVSKLRPEIR